MHLALLRPESLVIFQVQSLPVPLNGPGSMTSPRTSLDLNFDFQTTRVPFLWQPCILPSFYRSVKCFDKLFSTNLAALCQLDLFSVSSGGERILPLPDPDFNPPITTNSREFLRPRINARAQVSRFPGFQWIQAFAPRQLVGLFLAGGLGSLGSVLAI